MNQNQILLYIYKQFFNKKNVSFSVEFSQALIKLLATDIILRYMREKIQTIVDVNANNCLPVLDGNTSNNNDDVIDGTITEKSHVFESDDDESRV